MDYSEMIKHLNKIHEDEDSNYDLVYSSQDKKIEIMYK